MKQHKLGGGAQNKRVSVPNVVRRKNADRLKQLAPQHFQVTRQPLSATRSPSSRSPTDFSSHRVRVKGKFLLRDEEKFPVRGVTYGTFACDEPACEIFAQETVD